MCPLNTSWTAACDAKAFPFADTTFALQEEDTEDLEELFYGFPDEAIPLSRSFYIQFSCPDPSPELLACVKQTAIANAQGQALQSRWTQQRRTPHLHNNAWSELLHLWSAHLRPIDNFRTDDLTLDVRNASCTDACCSDSAAKLVYDLSWVSYGIPAEFQGRGERYEVWKGTLDGKWLPAHQNGT